MPSSSKLASRRRMASVDANIAAAIKRRDGSKSKTPPSSPSPAPTSKPRSRRHATLFDAVAGRITTNGFIDQPSAQKPSYYRDVPAHGNAQSSRSILRPDEVLSRQKGAPERYEEDDWYTQHRHLVASKEEAQRVRNTIDRINERDWREDGITDQERVRLEGMAGVGARRFPAEVIEKLKANVKVGTLPDGELLAAVHEFASLYYGVHGREFDFRSLDETALLAMGVLLEETIRNALGDTGWKVFVEGVEDEEEEEEEAKAAEEDAVPRDVRGRFTGKTLDSKPEAVYSGRHTESASEEEEPPKKKRRKIIAEREWGDDW